MHDVQDGSFDRVYWEPSVQHASRVGITTALGTCVMYDGCVHGSWRAMRDRTNARHRAAGALGEEAWAGRSVCSRPPFGAPMSRQSSAYW